MDLQKQQPNGSYKMIGQVKELEITLTPEAEKEVGQITGCAQEEHDACTCAGAKS